MNAHDILDEGGTVALLFDPLFNLDELRVITRRVAASNYFVPGWIPSSDGPFNVESLLLARFVERVDHVILPDRNLVTRIARVAREGLPPEPDVQTQGYGDSALIWGCRGYGDSALIWPSYGDSALNCI